MSGPKQQPVEDAQLERYLDGELDQSAAQELSSALQSSPDLRARVHEMETTRELLRAHLLGAADEVDFAQMTRNILARCEGEEAASWGQRLQTWWGELVSAPRLLVPGVVAAAAAVLLLVVPKLVDDVTPTPLVPAAGGDLLANAGVEVSHIEADAQLAMVYQLPESRTTVIWIAEPDAERNDP